MTMRKRFEPSPTANDWTIWDYKHDVTIETPLMTLTEAYALSAKLNQENDSNPLD